MQILKKCILSFSAIFLLMAMGQQPPQESAREVQEDKAEKALEALRRAYSEGDIAGFFEWVNDEYYPGWADFRSDIASQFHGAGSRDLNFVLNQSAVEGDKTALKVRWQKRQVDSKNGEVRITEGSSEFIFLSSPEGKPELLDLRGQSPFL